MKEYLWTISAIILLAFVSCKETTGSKDVQNEIIGTYQYTGNLDGIAITAEDYFIFAVNMGTGSAMADSLNTGKNITNQFMVEAGTWSMQDSIVTCTILYDSNPAMVGTSFRYTYTLNGNNFTYNVLGDNGEITYRGSGIKLK